MREVRIGCMAPDHGHQVLVNRRAVSRDDHPAAELLVTLWRCQVLHSGGVLLEFPAPGEHVAVP